MNVALPSLRRSVASRGRAIYREKIRPNVYPRLKGQIVAIDVDSGDYEIDDDDAQAHRRLRARRPNARMWAERIGYSAVDSFGGGLVPDDDD